MLLALLILAAPTPLLAGPTPAQERHIVHVTTSDGEVLVGTLETESFRLETGFGSAEVNADQVKRIEFGAPTIITVLDGPVLEGELKLRSLKLVVGRKTETLRTAKLTLLERPSALLEAGGPFQGSWASSHGPMTLTQEGKGVKGTYGWVAGTLTGTVEGDRLTVTWNDGYGNEGPGHFELWEDGDTFTGEFDTDEQEGLFWGAYRLLPTRAEPRPGLVTTGQTEAWLNYHLRVPKDFSPERAYTGLVLLHGSNMSARAYVDTFAAAWPELAERYVLVGLDGERISAASSKGVRAHNATYVEFSGHEIGEAWRHRQTPALVADSLKQLQGQLPIERWFVGGHSQGGFLTWAVAMFYPDLVAGAFPTSASLLVQCEPDFFDDPKLEAAQRKVPFAIVHGENDSVVAFSGSQHAYEAFQDGGFPALRLFAHPSAAHLFARLPVDEAIQWLEIMTNPRAEPLVEAAEAFFEAGEFRDAQAALLRAEDASGSGSQSARIARLRTRLDAEAARREGGLLADITADRGNAWVETFWEYRRQFAFTSAARDVLAAYQRLRELHEPGAIEVYYSARNTGDEAARLELYRRIVHEFYASSYYPLVSRWIQ